MAAPEVGRVVILKVGHPWAGHHGVVVHWMPVMLHPEMGPMPVVKLDNGIMCMITDLAKDWKYDLRVGL